MASETSKCGSIVAMSEENKGGNAAENAAEGATGAASANSAENGEAGAASANSAANGEANNVAADAGAAEAGEAKGFEPVEPVTEEDLETWSAGSDVKTKSWYSIPTAAWAVAVVALVVVGAAGYWLGARSNEVATGDVNLVGATSGQAALAPTPGEDGTFDATIYGPKDGAQLSSASDMDDLHRREASDPFSIGAVDAPVVISMYSDFECPFCANFATQTEPQIMEDYVNTGLVRLEWNDMAVNGDKAVKAAEAGRAAAAQGSFWEFASALFDKSAKKGSGHPEFSEDDLIATAREVGVEDMARFEKELKKGTYTDAVKEATEFASSLGISGTPAFVVGTQYVSGAQPLEVFQNNIEMALISAKRAENAGK